LFVFFAVFVRAIFNVVCVEISFVHVLCFCVLLVDEGSCLSVAVQLIPRLISEMILPYFGRDVECCSLSHPLTHQTDSEGLDVSDLYTSSPVSVVHFRTVSKLGQCL